MRKDRRFIGFDTKEFKKQVKLFLWLMAGITLLLIICRG
jgi:hypothetical protein